MIEILLQAERALSVGMVDRAEELYRQAADADARNSIAVVGLARVALERADESGALELGRRALTIDPENDAAKRLVVRLEEVSAYRARSSGPPDTPPGEPASPIATQARAGTPPVAPRQESQAATAPPSRPATVRPRRGIIRRLLGRR